MYGQGVSYQGDLLDLAVDRNIVQKSGSWYSYKGDRIGQGRENTKGWLEGQPDVCQEIERQILIHEGVLVEDEDASLSGKMAPEVN